MLPDADNTTVLRLVFFFTLVIVIVVAEEIICGVSELFIEGLRVDDNASMSLSPILLVIRYNQHILLQLTVAGSHLPM